MLMSKLQEIPVADIIQVCRAANALSSHCTAVNALSNEDSDEERPIIDRHGLSMLLLKKKEHVLQPVQLGPEDLSNKCASFVWQVWCVAMNIVLLLKILMSICAVTTDLGTEAGVSDFRVADVKRLLPNWVDTFAIETDDDEDSAPESCGELPVLVPDVDCGESDAEGDVLHPDADKVADNDSDRFLNEICSNYLMPLSMQIAGACHLLHSVSKESFENLQHWDTFWGQLKVLDCLLMVQFRLEKLVATCCVEKIDKDFLLGVRKVRLYKKRWNVVHLFLVAVCPVMSTLRRVWQLDRYGRTLGPDDEATNDGFNPKDVTDLLADNVFSVYVSLVMFVHGIQNIFYLGWRVVVVTTSGTTTLANRETRK